MGSWRGERQKKQFEQKKKSSAATYLIKKNVLFWIGLQKTQNETTQSCTKTNFCPMQYSKFAFHDKKSENRLTNRSSVDKTAKCQK